MSGEVRLVDLDDTTHVLKGVVVKRTAKVVTVKHVVSVAFPFKPEVSWTQRFDAATGKQMGDHPAFKIHSEDL